MKTHFRKLIFGSAAAAALAIAGLLSGCSTVEDLSEGGSGDGKGSVVIDVAGVSESPTDTRALAETKTTFAPDSVGGLSFDAAAVPVKSSTRASNPMTSGNTYVALLLDGSSNLVARFDGTAGTATAKQQVTAGTYTLVAFSFNSTDNLTAMGPTTVGASANVSITAPAGKDLLYYSGSYTVNTGTNTATFSLSHKLALIASWVVNSKAMLRTVQAVSATIGTYAASINLSTGSLTQGTAGTVTMTIPTGSDIVTSTFPAGSPSANNKYLPVYPGVSYTANYTTLNLGTDGNTNFSSKSGTLTSLTANTAYTVTSRVSKCGATVNGAYKLFMCYNLGSGITNSVYADPLAAGSYLTNGAYWQWGNLASSMAAPTDASGSDAGTISGWNASNYNTNLAAWNSGTETAPVKTANDPCPTGYRVPTRNEWTGTGTSGVLLNSKTAVGTWTAGASSFNSGCQFKTSGGVVSLYLPAPGWRDRNVTGILFNRNAAGLYWSSTSRTDIAGYDAAYYISVMSSGAAEGDFYKANAYSVRCIAE